MPFAFGRGHLIWNLIGIRSNWQIKTQRILTSSIGVYNVIVYTNSAMMSTLAMLASLKMM